MRGRSVPALLPLVFGQDWIELLTVCLSPTSLSLWSRGLGRSLQVQVKKIDHFMFVCFFQKV